jgi:hypothetical protein
LASAATGGGPCFRLASRRAAGRLAGVAGGSGQPAQRAGMFIARRGLGQGWTTTRPERLDRRSGGPGVAAGGTGAGGRTRMAGALESHG